MIADVCCSRHDAAPYLAYDVMVCGRTTLHGVTPRECRVTIARLRRCSSNRPGSNTRRHAASEIEMHREPGSRIAVDQDHSAHAAASIAGQGQIAGRD